MFLFFYPKLNCPEAVIEALSVNDNDVCVTIVRLGEGIGSGFRANPECHRYSWSLCRFSPRQSNFYTLPVT